MPKPIIDYGSYVGGLNADLAPHLLADNQLQIADNVDLSTQAIRKRQGTAKLNATSYGGEVGRIIEWRRNDGSTVWLAVVTVGGTVSLNLVNKSNGALTQICALNKADIGWFWWQDKFYFADGAKYRVYNGSAVGEVVPGAPGAPTVEARYGEAGGDITTTGYRVCAVTMVTADGKETALGAGAGVTINVSEQTKSIAWSGIPTGDGMVTARKLYRTKAGTSSPFYLLTVLYNNTATTYGDHTDDNGLGAAYTAPTRDLSAVSRSNRLIFHPHSQRVFAAGDTSDRAAVYHSATGDPSEFRSNWKRYPPTGFADVRALSVFGDALLAHYASGHLRWKGADPMTDVTWFQMPVNVGPVSPLAVSLVPNALMFLGQGGPYIVSPAALETDYVLQAGDSIVRNIAEDKYATLITGAADLSQAATVYDHLRERLFLAYKAEASSAGNDRVLVIEWDTQAAAVWKGFRANHFCLCADGTLLAASTNYILRLNQAGYTDVDPSTGNAVPVSLKVKTKPWDFARGKLRKKVFSLFISTQAVSGGTLDVRVSGGVSDVVKTGINVSAGGTFETRCSAKGERFAVQVDNGSAQAVIVDSLGFTYKTLRAKGKEV